MSLVKLDLEGRAVGLHRLTENGLPPLLASIFVLDDSESSAQSLDARTQLEVCLLPETRERIPMIRLPDLNNLAETTLCAFQLARDPSTLHV